MVYSVGVGVLDDPAAFRRRKPPRRRTRAQAPAAGPGQPDGTGAAGRAISQDRALKKSASGRPRPWAASRAASALPRDTAHTDHHTPPGVPSPAAARPRHGSWRTARWPSAAPTEENAAAACNHRAVWAASAPHPVRRPRSLRRADLWAVGPRRRAAAARRRPVIRPARRSRRRSDPPPRPGAGRAAAAARPARPARAGHRHGQR